MKNLALTLVALFTLAAVSCGSKQESKKTGNTTLSGDIKIDGSSTVYPITEAIAEEYRSEQTEVRVTVGVSGTGGGFKKFYRGETDINDASRPIKSKEIKICEENGISYVGLSVAYDGLAVLKNPANDWLTSITVEELNKLWIPQAQDSIMYWNQIREGWPNEEIHLYGPGVASGTYDYFAEVICGKKVGTRGDYTASEDDNVLVQGIATDKYALGFFGLAYYEENKDKLDLVSVDNGNGAVFPSMETVSSGEYAPLSRPIFIYVSNKAAEKPEVVDFVNFYLNSAGDIAKEVGYVALPAEEYQVEIDKFDAFVKK
ncbi:PstS family phosphate ABC transporter substrate-binding protein [Flavobacteriales bacterium]|nr:PstS family phosphate ABC transporter substrate-binding protein [Flavobacteriales bacterium]